MDVITIIGSMVVLYQHGCVPLILMAFAWIPYRLSSWLLVLFVIGGYRGHIVHIDDIEALLRTSCLPVRNY